MLQTKTPANPRARRCFANTPIFEVLTLEAVSNSNCEDVIPVGRHLYVCRIRRNLCRCYIRFVNKTELVPSSQGNVFGEVEGNAWAQLANESCIAFTLKIHALIKVCFMELGTQTARKI